jgi:ABC-type branched-subunit amino acid transport system substrate-binding protein
MKRALAVMCVVGLALTACKSSDDDASTSSTSTTEAMSTEPGQGVTDSAIKVGVTYTDLEAIKDIVNIDHGDYLSAFQALADDINANGGINGRQIEIVAGPVDPVGTDSAATVCTQLTEDEQVFAVIGNVQAEVTSCYVTDHDTALVGGQQTPETLAAAMAPWFAYDAGLDFTARKTIEGSADDGVFTDKKVAVVSLPVHADLMTDTIDPALEAAGADVVNRAVIDAPPEDQAAATSQAQTFAERFRADGVEVVVAVGDAFLTFARGLEQTDYRPSLVATDANVVQSYLVGRTDFSVMTGLITGGPPGPEQGWNSASMQDCVAKIQDAQPDRVIEDPVTATPDTPNTWVSVTVACQAMTLFQAIADKAGDVLNNDTFRAAGESLGTIEVPGKGGPSNFTPESPSGDPPVFLGRWDPSTEKLVIDTTPVA